MPKFAFVLSSGRTGTKFLAHFFKANYPGVLARHEPFPSYHLRMLSNARAAGRLSAVAMVTTLQVSRPVFRRFRGDLYIESNSFLYGFADVLDRAIRRDGSGKPILIHVVRDPRTYVASAINHGGSTGIKALATSLVPYWFPPVLRVPGVGRRPTPVEMFAGEWALVNRWLTECGRPRPHYYLLRFEDIFDEGNSGLRQLCQILGLIFPDEATRVSPREKVNPSQLKVMGGWRTWAREDCAALDRVCGTLMREFGYGAEPEWAALCG